MNEGLAVFARGIIGFFTLLIFTRILGKQQVSQLTLFEYILGITIGSTASTLTTDLNSSAWSHWIGLFVWSLLVFLLQMISVRFPKFTAYINGEPELIIVNGKIMDKKMKGLRYSLTDLLEQLRANNIFDIKQVEFAVLESNGQLTVLKKSQYETVTAHDLGLKTDYSGISTELIIYGIIVQENLDRVGLSKKWLMEELNKRKIKNTKLVHLASLDSNGNLYIDLYKDYQA